MPKQLQKGQKRFWLPAAECPEQYIENHVKRSCIMNEDGTSYFELLNENDDRASAHEALDTAAVCRSHKVYLYTEGGASGWVVWDPLHLLYNRYVLRFYMIEDK